jgi:hypothetical protein
MCRDNTKGLRRARFLFNGGELNALFARGLLEQGHTIKRKNVEKRRINYINHDINSSPGSIYPYDEKTSSTATEETACII